MWAAVVPVPVTNNAGRALSAFKFYVASMSKSLMHWLRYFSQPEQQCIDLTST